MSEPGDTSARLRAVQTAAKYVQRLPDSHAAFLRSVDRNPFDEFADPPRPVRLLP